MKSNTNEDTEAKIFKRITDELGIPVCKARDAYMSGLAKIRRYLITNYKLREELYDALPKHHSKRNGDKT